MTKIGTRDSDTTLKVKMSKVKVTRPLYSARPQRVRRLQRSALERIGGGKLLLRCVCSARDGGGEERGILCRHAHSLFWTNHVQAVQISNTV